MKITSEQIEFFKQAQQTIKKGYYPDGKKAIDFYKEIFAEEIANGKISGNLNHKCGSCIRQSVQKVNEAINKLEKETQNNEQQTDKENKGT